VSAQLLLTNFSDKYLRFGLVLGGIEYAITGNWSAKVEYNYTRLGNENVRFCPGPGAGWVLLRPSGSRITSSS
jgi:opacity protein-like surface antigen